MAKSNSAAVTETVLSAEDRAALEQQRAGVEPAVEPPVEPTETETAAQGEPEAPAEEPAEPREPRMVNYAALKEERDARKQERERAERAERLAEEQRKDYQQKFEALLARIPQAEVKTDEPAPVPTIEQDPLGHLVETMRRQGATLQQINEAVETQKVENQRRSYAVQVQSRASAMEQEFRKETPDYQNAIDYLVSFRDRQLAAQGVADPVERRRLIGEEAFGFADSALRRGQNVAEGLYNYAIASGYQKAEADPKAAEEDPAKRLDTIERGQKQARSVGNVRGSGPSPVTADSLIDMPMDKFIEMMKNPPADVRRLMGA